MLLLRSSPLPESLNSLLLSPLIYLPSLLEEIIIWEKHLGKGPLAGAAPGLTLPNPTVFQRQLALALEHLSCPTRLSEGRTGPKLPLSPLPAY